MFFIEIVGSIYRKYIVVVVSHSGRTHVEFTVASNGLSHHKPWDNHIGHGNSDDEELDSTHNWRIISAFSLLRKPDFIALNVKTPIVQLP